MLVPYKFKGTKAGLGRFDLSLHTHYTIKVCSNKSLKGVPISYITQY